MTGDHDVWLEQYALKELGFYMGKLDGSRGPVTRKARADWELSLVGTVRDVSQDGIDLVKAFEGLYLKAYRCPAGVWTIGYGHTGLRHKDGTVYEGRRISKEDAEDLLRHDLRKFAKSVSLLVKVPLTDDEFAALVSFHFNTGALSRSTLLTMLNNGDKRAAADEFLRWDKVGNRQLPGLARRRKSERNLFLSIRPFIVPS